MIIDNGMMGVSQLKACFFPIHLAVDMVLRWFVILMICVMVYYSVCVYI